VAVDAYKPHREIYGRWMQRLSRDLETKLQPGDEIAYRSPIEGQRETFDWYMARFGERVSWQGPPVVHAETKRVWLIVLKTKEPGRDGEADLLAELGTNWESVSRTEEMVQPATRNCCAVYGTVHCLVRSE
jgi:hypothetical protein